MNLWLKDFTSLPALRHCAGQDVIALCVALQLCSLKAKDLPFQRDNGERMTFRIAIK